MTARTDAPAATAPSCRCAAVPHIARRPAEQSETALRCAAAAFVVVAGNTGGGASRGFSGRCGLGASGVVSMGSGTGGLPETTQYISSTHLTPVRNSPGSLEDHVH
jgi:hypothetical protein